MPAAFRQTLRALSADHHRRRRTLLVFVAIALLLLAWLGWFVLAGVPIHAVSDRARIQASDQVHPVDVQISGRVVSVHLPVGASVRAGETLLVLDTTDVGLRLAETRATQRGLAAQIEALEAELAARQQALAETEKVGQASVSEAAALRQETQATAGLAAKEDRRVEKLHQAGVVPEADRDRAQASVVEKQAALTARARRLTVLETQARRDVVERRAANANLARTLAELRADHDRAAVHIARLDDELERHTVRAPISGRLGDVRAPQVGSVVAVGQTVAVVTPDGALQVIADFSPSDAVGRIRVGQPARMRVTGFAWTQYGMLHATVSAMSSEVMDGRIRVELTLKDNERSAIPVSHGLTGIVEIELEEISPRALVLRAVGQLLTEDQRPE
jgi:membrane fusion protein (multidrug efflux system)